MVDKEPLFVCALIIYSSLLSWLLVTCYEDITDILWYWLLWLNRSQELNTNLCKALNCCINTVKKKKTKLNTQNAQQYTFFSVICTFSSPLQWNIDLSANGLEKFVRYIRYLDLSLLVCLVFIFNLQMLTFFIRYIKVYFTICASRLCLLRWGFC